MKARWHREAIGRDALHSGERAILTRFDAGMAVAQIAAETGFSRSYTAAIIARLHGGRNERPNARIREGSRRLAEAVAAVGGSFA